MATLYVRDFPEELHAKIKARARENRRSVAAEVVVALDQALGGDDRVSRRLKALERLSDLRRSNPQPPDAVDTLTLLREDRAR